MSDELITQEEFDRKQQELYSNFDALAEEAMEKGLIRDMSVHKRTGGRIVAFRWPFDLSSSIAEFSERIYSSLGRRSLVYYIHHVHTTSVVHGLEKNFSPPESPKSETFDDSEIKKLTEAVYTAKKKNEIVVPTIDYKNFLFNRQCVIAEGHPDRGFVATANAIAKEYEGEGKLRPPYMAHITASRFIENMEQEEIMEFLELMKEAPRLGKYKPEKLDVGYYTTSLGGFHFHTIESFGLY